MVMKSHVVNATEWTSFADRFSRSHEGWVASLEISEPNEPPKIEVDESPFRGATIEKHDSGDTFVLTFGYEPEEHFAHIIHGPHSIVSSETDDRSQASLIIESVHGDRCTLGLINPLNEEDLVAP